MIRLQRTGRSKIPTYRLVVAEKARPVKGKFLEVLGHYLPASHETTSDIKQDRVKFWMSKGAIPSNTTARLLRKIGMEGMEKFIETYTKKKSKNEQPAEAAPAAAAPAAA